MKKINFIKKARGIFDICLKILDMKNSDYATDDALSNFRTWGSQGVVVRIGDKYERLKNIYLKHSESESDETVEDTLLDLINYCAICLIMRELEWEHQQKKEE